MDTPKQSNKLSFYNSRREIQIQDDTPPSTQLTSTPVRQLLIPETSPHAKSTELIVTPSSKLTSTPNQQSATCLSLPENTPIAMQSELTKAEKRKPNIMFLKPVIPKTNIPADKTLTKTASILITIFGEQQFISKYNSDRIRMKECNNNENRVNYRHSIAVVEVKIVNKHDELKSMLADMEKQSIHVNGLLDGNVNALPANNHDKKMYNDCLKKLEYLKILKREICLPNLPK